MDESKILNVTIGDPVKNDPILDKFSDEPIQPTKEEETNARTFLKNVKDYIQSSVFEEDCIKKAKKTGQSPKKVATTYIGKVAGIIGDGLGMAVDTIEISGIGLISLINTLLTKAVVLICNVVRGIIRTVTFNRTNHTPAMA